MPLLSNRITLHSLDITLQSVPAGTMSVHTYSSTYIRAADEAFTTHGIRRQPLSALVFWEK